MMAIMNVWMFIDIPKKYNLLRECYVITYNCEYEYSTCNNNTIVKSPAFNREPI